ncbi:hypothetical protein [Allobranchiibius sp. GilTou73]|uniref:hypothetical protein n=1 Tax=Allobranchiibius sp. GilTou73 TaxID=2904523 RepID=UPI001F3290F2|nr:hypothetical protein [Allobranchiibius sp. GilTou73]UIJ33697.1 hypothetical protein LVQ62_11055 [Allobranchiibius sp. GilTou73]
MSSPTNESFSRRAERPAGDGSQESTAGQAKEAAADVASHGQQAAADVARTGQQAAAQVAGEAKERASDLLGQTRTQLREQAETQRTTAVQALQDLGRQLSAMTTNASSNDAQGAAIDAVTTARDRVSAAAEWLERRDPDQVLDDVRKFGRQRPGAFLLSAALAGVAAGRLTRGVVAQHIDTNTDSDDDQSTVTPAPSESGVSSEGRAGRE